MHIVNLSRDRLVEMKQVFCEAVGVSPRAVGDDALWAYFDAGRAACERRRGALGSGCGWTVTAAASAGR